jgi:pSer/pThr/pTyr-binding forkhead associated (FHA) protein
MLKLQFRGEPGTFVKLSVATVTLGRDESNDLVIASPSVSDFHAEITTDAQHPCIIDLLSKTGTFVNEYRITGKVALQAWDVIRLGSVELEVTDPNGHRPNDWALKTESDLLASQFYTLQAETVVGRDPACDLTIDSNLLSRQHAKLIIDEEHLRIIDLESANGTYVNGIKITETNAHPGDEIRFDQQKFVVIGPTPPQQLAQLQENQTEVRGHRPETDDTAFRTVSAPIGDTRSSGDTVMMDDEEETRFYTPAPKVAHIVELGHNAQAQQFTLEKEQHQIGRSEACEFFLEDKSVSKRHAQFTFSQGRWNLEDLDSSNGVLVNGTRIEQVILADGDKLKLGRREFEFLEESPPDNDAEPATRIYQPTLRGLDSSRAKPTAAKLDKLPRWKIWGALVLFGAGSIIAVLLIGANL